MQKSKKFRLAPKMALLLAIITATLVLLIPMAGPAQAACIAGDTGGCPSGTSPTTTAASTSDVCNPENDNPPSQALTPEQRKSCVACNNNSGLHDCLHNNIIISRLQQIIDFLSAGVGIIVVAMIIIGGIQYSIAGDNPQRLTAARQRIINALIALVAFMFIFAFVQWLIPGGIFN